MGLYEDLRNLAEQIKKRQAHVKGEEATKQALVLPFLQVLGFDIYDPTEVKPEYIADFAKKKSGGQFEKIDYAITLKGEPAIFVECKAVDVAVEDHDGQLARYFNSTPSVPPNIRRLGSVSETDWPLVVNQLRLRQTKRPPSVTMNEGMP